jgi:hypothetical protein
MGMFADLVNKAARAATGGGDNAPKYTYDPNTQMYTQMAKGGKVGSASKRADGIAQRGKTRGKVI